MVRFFPPETWKRNNVFLQLFRKMKVIFLEVSMYEARYMEKKPYFPHIYSLQSDG